MRWQWCCNQLSWALQQSRIAGLLWTTKICEEDPNYRIEAEVYLNKTWQFLQACIIMFKNKHNFWIFYLNKFMYCVFFFQFLNKGSTGTLFIYSDFVN